MGNDLHNAHKQPVNYPEGPLPLHRNFYMKKQQMTYRPQIHFEYSLCAKEIYSFFSTKSAYPIDGPIKIMCTSFVVSAPAYTTITKVNGKKLYFKFFHRYGIKRKQWCNANVLERFRSLIFQCRIYSQKPRPLQMLGDQSWPQLPFHYLASSE